MLDMIELGLVGYRGLEDLEGLAKRVGSKPAFVFTGEKWGREESYRKLQNILIGGFFALVLQYAGSTCCNNLKYIRFPSDAFLDGLPWSLRSATARARGHVLHLPRVALRPRKHPRFTINDVGELRREGVTGERESDLTEPLSYTVQHYTL